MAVSHSPPHRSFQWLELQAVELNSSEEKEECYSVNYTRVFALAVVAFAYWNRREVNVYCRAFFVALVYWFRKDVLRHLRAIAMAVLQGRVEEIIITHSTKEREGELPRETADGLVQQPRRRGRPSKLSRQFSFNRNVTVFGSAGHNAAFLTGVIALAAPRCPPPPKECYAPDQEPLVRRTRTGTIYGIF